MNAEAEGKGELRKSRGYFLSGGCGFHGQEKEYRGWGPEAQMMASVSCGMSQAV